MKFIDSIIQLGHNVYVLGYLRESDNFKTRPNWHVIDRRRIESESAIFFSVLWGGWAQLKRTPYSVEKYYSKKCLIDLRRYMKAANIEVLVVDHTQMAWVLKYLNTSGLETVTIVHNVESELYNDLANSSSSYLKRLIYRRESRLINKYEKLMCEKSNQIWCISPDDMKQLSTKWNNVFLFDFPMEPAERCTEIEKQYDIGLIGTWSWSANREGLSWFVKEIVPKIVGKVTIAVAGRGAEWLRDINNIVYLGYVNDSLNFLCKCKVMAVPSIAGGGIQIKTIEAISAGHSVVATSKGVRGIKDLPSSVSVSDDPESFAKKLLQAVENYSVSPHFLIGTKWAEKRNNEFRLKIKARLSQLQCDEKL